VRVVANEAGEDITLATAKEIVADAKKKGRRTVRSIPSDKLALRLVRVLERYRERRNPKEEGQGVKAKCSDLTNRRRANVCYDEHSRSWPRRPGP
jgi:hypothetical protein